MTSLTLTPAEVAELTGYQQPAKQLAELHRQGFHRARVAPTGRVVLERAHYLAVAASQVQQAVAQRPRLRPVA